MSCHVDTSQENRQRHESSSILSECGWIPFTHRLWNFCTGISVFPFQALLRQNSPLSVLGCFVSLWEKQTFFLKIIHEHWDLRGNALVHQQPTYVITVGKIPTCTWPEACVPSHATESRGRHAGVLSLYSNNPRQALINKSVWPCINEAPDFSLPTCKSLFEDSDIFLKPILNWSWCSRQTEYDFPTQRPSRVTKGA